MHEYGRLCVGCNRHSRSCPVKRLRVSLDLISEVDRHSEAERTQAQIRFERPSGAERARAAVSGAPAEPSWLERPFRAPQRSRAGSSGHFERPSAAERARAAISSAPAEPSGLERPFRAPQRSRAGLERLFRAPQRSRAGSSGPFRATQPSRAGPSGHFERPSGAERARSRKRRQGRCSRGRPSRVKPRTACGASKPP